MKIQPVTYQPSFDGKIKGRGVLLLKDSHWDVPQEMDKYSCLELPDNLLNKLRLMIKEKPYDIFVSQNKSNPEFVNIDANTSFEAVEKGIQGKVKVSRNAVEALPEAFQKAMDIFEEHLADLKAKKKFLPKESA